MNIRNRLIPTLGIFSARKERCLPFQTIGETVKYLNERQSLFISALAFGVSENRFSPKIIGQRQRRAEDINRFGWEKITYREDLRGTDAQPSTGAGKTDFLDTFFTGASLCELASFAMFDGLSGVSKENLDFRVVSMNVFFNKENLSGAGAFYREVYGYHAFVKITDTATGEQIFIDPTYGQINSQYAGRFLIFSPSEIGSYYQTRAKQEFQMFPEKRNLSVDDLTDVSSRRAVELEYLADLYAITDSTYSRITRTLDPNTKVSLTTQNS